MGAAEPGSNASRLTTLNVMASLRTTDRWRTKERWRKRPARDAVADLAKLAEQRREVALSLSLSIKLGREPQCDLIGTIGSSGTWPGCRERTWVTTRTPRNTAVATARMAKLGGSFGAQ
jgi:hypothetical protein